MRDRVSLYLCAVLENQREVWINSAVAHMCRIVLPLLISKLFVQTAKSLLYLGWQLYFVETCFVIFDFDHFYVAALLSNLNHFAENETFLPSAKPFCRKRNLFAGRNQFAGQWTKPETFLTVAGDAKLRLG